MEVGVIGLHSLSAQSLVVLVEIKQEQGNVTTLHLPMEEQIVQILKMIRQKLNLATFKIVSNITFITSYQNCYQFKKEGIKQV